MLDKAITDYVSSAPRLAKSIPCNLSDRELRFLALLGSSPLAEGEVLAIGGGLARSITVLAEAARLVGESRVSLIDPLDTDFYQTTSDVIEANLANAGVDNIVDFHQVFPEEISEIWDRPLRLLWIGAAHSADGAEVDFDEYCEHLTDGAVVAFENVVRRRDSGLMVFTEDILIDDHFGAAGVCGSVGWARYHDNPADAKKFYNEKAKLYQRLTPLLPFATKGDKVSWWSWLSLKLQERRVPQQDVEPDTWLRYVA